MKINFMKRSDVNTLLLSLQPGRIKLIQKRGWFALVSKEEVNAESNKNLHSRVGCKTG